MTINIPAEIVALTKLSSKEVRLALAIWLFTEKNLSLGLAAKFAGMHKIAFQWELAERKIAVHYTEEDLLKDFKAAKEQK